MCPTKKLLKKKNNNNNDIYQEIANRFVNAFMRRATHVSCYSSFRFVFLTVVPVCELDVSTLSNVASISGENYVTVNSSVQLTCEFGTFSSGAKTRDFVCRGDGGRGRWWEPPLEGCTGKTTLTYTVKSANDSPKSTATTVLQVYSG